MIVTYVDGEGKSGQYYAARFAEENRILAQAILSPVKFSQMLGQYREKHREVAAVVIIDDIIATGSSLANKLNFFVRENEGALKELNLPLVVISITATAVGEQKVREAMDEFEWLDFELRTCDPLPDQQFAFHSDNSIWKNNVDFDRAYALCRDLGVNIYRDAPVGFGDQGLLIVFPETCPNNTLPIIHSASRPDALRNWLPLFPRVAN